MKRRYVLQTICGVVIMATFAFVLKIGCPCEDAACSDAVAIADVPEETLQRVMSLADSIGELKLLPMDGYWDERKIADAEDEREGFKREAPLSVSIMGRNWRPDISKYGPRSRACEEKWRPVVEQNAKIAEQRRSALQRLRAVLETQLQGRDGESLSVVRSNIIVRAHLSRQEADLLFLQGNAQTARRCPADE